LSQVEIIEKLYSTSLCQKKTKLPSHQLQLLCNCSSSRWWRL